MTSYAAPYIPMGPIPVDGPCPYGRQLPGEVASSSSGPARGAPTYSSALYYDLYPQQGASWLVQEQQQQHDLFHGAPPSPIKRKALSNFHPYLYPHDTARSPTRARFQSTVSSSGHSSSHYDAPHSPVRPRKPYVPATDASYHAAQTPLQPAIQLQLPGRKRRLPSDESVESLTKVARDASATFRGPTNCERVPQGMFGTPASSSDFRYKDVSFHKEGFPEPGIRIREIGHPTFRLEGANDCTLSHTGDNFLRLQIMWPGYKPYSFKLKTVLEGPGKRPITHETIANKLRIEMVGFQRGLQIVDAQLAHSWRISEVPGDGGIEISELFLTHLVHRGGSHWQVALWAPMRQRR